MCKIRLRASMRGWLVARTRPSKGPSGTKRCRRPMFGCPTRIILLHPAIHFASAVRDDAIRWQASLASRDGLVLGGKIWGSAGDGVVLGLPPPFSPLLLWFALSSPHLPLSFPAPWTILRRILVDPPGVGRYTSPSPHLWILDLFAWWWLRCG
jgi:hypothetical protein